MSGRLTVIEDDVFAADLPAGEARLVYADPPYTLDDVHGYGRWPGTGRLLTRMLELGADDAVYVLHCGWPQLHEVLPEVERLAPARPVRYTGQPKHRLLAWVKPWARRPGRYKLAFGYQWEPVVLFFGSRFKWPRDPDCEADWICALRSETSANGHQTQKPDELLAWLYERILSGADGRLAIDLFAGTGGAAILAARLGLDAVAVERDPLMAARILENAELPPEVPGYAPLAVGVTVHGRPVWPTLGRVTLTEDLAALTRQRQQTPVPAARPYVDARLGEEAAAGEVEPEPADLAEGLHLRVSHGISVPGAVDG